ncbi:hypothetical protein OFS02_14350 [Brachyspira hyodysenteriae]|uniref:hypothetical protein n=1 Tax=Brachyspira hyodysenteriae TaxID=159 RepID=UPI0022CE0C47|nr:hypothetical protein [Brachyspira hyodysenteriae]MDA0093427.1 hypothetical protein [Brachyspira hyodysenteriae]
MLKRLKYSDPLNYSNATFGGFVQACVAKAKKEWEEKGSEMQKLEKRVAELEGACVKELMNWKIKLKN